MAYAKNDETRVKEGNVNLFESTGLKSFQTSPFINLLKHFYSPSLRANVLKYYEIHEKLKRIRRKLNLVSTLSTHVLHVYR